MNQTRSNAALLPYQNFVFSIEKFRVCWKKLQQGRAMGENSLESELWRGAPLDALNCVKSSQLWHPPPCLTPFIRFFFLLIFTSSRKLFDSFGHESD